MPRYLPSSRVLHMQRRALAAGGTARQTADASHSRLVEWDIAGNCTAPVLVEITGRPEGNGPRLITRSNPSRFMDIHVACRKCDNCLRRRAAMWRYRAVAEWRMAPRTWLATYTLRPESYVHLLSRARVRMAKAGTDYESMTVHDRFLEVEKEGFHELQLWLKRLRKSGVMLRYLAITESHKSGVPHWHMLIHERDPDKPVRHKDLAGSWPLGFDDYRLVANARAAGYVAKYLNKSVSARVRASQRYGQAEDLSLPP